jgi:anti-sigma regulatory factor (Ser/Thr protein kinase)
MIDEITLTFPREPDFQRVAHLVLGGLAVRLNLTIENLEDLQIALDSLLERTDHEDNKGDVTVRMSVHDDALEAVVGPLSSRLLDEIDEEAGDELRLRRVLESTVDDVHVDGDSVRLTKRVGGG